MAADDDYRRHGARWGWRTPSPDFARRAVSPISPPRVRTDAMATSPDLNSSPQLSEHPYPASNAAQASYYSNEAPPAHPTDPSPSAAPAHQPPPFRPAPTWQQSSEARQYTDPLDILASVAVAERQHRQLVSSARSMSSAFQPHPLPSASPLRFDNPAGGIVSTTRSSGPYSSSPSSRSYSRSRKTARPTTPPQRSPVVPHRDAHGYASSQRPEEYPPAVVPGPAAPQNQHASMFANPQPISPELRERLSPASSRASAQRASAEHTASTSPRTHTMVSPLLQKARISSPVAGRSSLTVPSPSMVKAEIAHVPSDITAARAPSPAVTPQLTAALPAHAHPATPGRPPDSADPPETVNPPAEPAGETPEAAQAKDEFKEDQVMQDANASLPTPTQDDHVVQDPVNLLNALVAQNEASNGRDIAQFTPEAGEAGEPMQVDSPEKPVSHVPVEETVSAAKTSAPAPETDSSGDIEMADSKAEDVAITQPAPLPTVPEADEAPAHTTVSVLPKLPGATLIAQPKTRKQRSGSRALRKSVDRTVTKQAATSRPVEGQETCQTCGVPYAQDDGHKGPWIECDACKSWVHALCAGIEQGQVKKIDKFFCGSCQKTYGPPTMKRSSNRAHTAIDYNALHNGSAVPLRNPEDARIHPYINTIRDKTFPFAEESFPRLRAEQVTVEYLDNLPGGWNEPFVVPAQENVRPWHEEDIKLDDPETPTSVPSPVELAGSKPMLPDSVKDARSASPEKPRDRDGLDMRIPRGLTVRKVGEAVGMDRPVEVIKVLTQSSAKDERWKMNDLVNYFESPVRDVIYNCISCEVSTTDLGTQISRPRAVRETDLVDRVWRNVPYMARPTVGKYVLMSVKDSFTDFHIDFAGSSVFYHVYEGEKVFLLIEPTEKALKAYELWNMDPHMSAKFFPESIPEIPCRILTLHKGDTMFIPSGWIHAVYTPVDTLVIGGNFLTKNHYGNQMKVHHIEVVTGVAPSMKYPRYTTLMWFQALHYLETDPVPEDVDALLLDGRAPDSTPQPEDAPKYTPQELDGLPHLLKFLHRNVMISVGAITTSQAPGNAKLTQKTIDAVKRAAPDPINKDPLGFLKRFARWCTWRRIVGGVAPREERIPEWAHTEWVPTDRPTKPETSGKKASAKSEGRFSVTSETPRRAGLRDRRATSISPDADAAHLNTTSTAEQATTSTSSSSFTSASTKTPSATTTTAAVAASGKRKSESDATPTSSAAHPPSNKKPKTSKTSRSASSTAATSRVSEIPIILGEGEQRVILSDGSIYVRKNSNLGPPRAGCQNCRLKKTGCKHKEEIAEILKGTWTAARAAHQARLEKEREREKEGKERSAGGGKDAAGQAGPGKEGGDNAGRGAGRQPEEMVLDEYAIASESDDEPLSSPPPPPPQPVSKRRKASSAKKEKVVSLSPPPPPPTTTTSTRSQPATTTTEQTTATSAAPPATVVNGTGPPAGFKGRKPSCNECKALKKKCLHPNTWYNLPSRPANHHNHNHHHLSAITSRKSKNSAASRRKSTSNISDSKPLVKDSTTTAAASSSNTIALAAPPPPPPPPAAAAADVAAASSTPASTSTTTTTATTTNTATNATPTTSSSSPPKTPDRGDAGAASATRQQQQLLETIPATPPTVRKIPPPLSGGRVNGVKGMNGVDAVDIDDDDDEEEDGEEEDEEDEDDEEEDEEVDAAGMEVDGKESGGGGGARRKRREYVVTLNTAAAAAAAASPTTTITTSASASKTKPRTTTTAAAAGGATPSKPPSSSTVTLKTPKHPSSSSASASASASSSHHHHHHPPTTPMKRRAAGGGSGADDDHHQQNRIVSAGGGGSAERVRKRVSVDRLGGAGGGHDDAVSPGKGKGAAAGGGGAVGGGGGDEAEMMRAMALGLRVRKASVVGR